MLIHMPIPHSLKVSQLFCTVDTDSSQSLLFCMKSSVSASSIVYLSNPFSPVHYTKISLARLDYKSKLQILQAMLWLSDCLNGGDVARA